METCSNKHGGIEVQKLYYNFINFNKYKKQKYK